MLFLCETIIAILSNYYNKSWLEIEIEGLGGYSSLQFTQDIVRLPKMIISSIDNDTRDHQFNVHPIHLYYFTSYINNMFYWFLGIDVLLILSNLSSNSYVDVQSL